MCVESLSLRGDLVSCHRRKPTPHEGTRVYQLCRVEVVQLVGVLEDFNPSGPEALHAARSERRAVKAQSQRPAEANRLP